MTWLALEAQAPELARAGRERFERTHVALLGTLRADGWPRISPVEPFILEASLVFGVMRSPKWNDLRRDARCLLHSSVSDVGGSEGEFKVYGRATPTDEPSVLRFSEAWWASRPRDQFEVYAIDIAEAVLVAWNTKFSRMQTIRWTPAEGPRDDARTYP